jgi:hypothetical protein
MNVNYSNEKLNLILANENNLNSISEFLYPNELINLSLSNKKINTQSQKYLIYSMINTYGIQETYFRKKIFFEFNNKNILEFFFIKTEKIFNKFSHKNKKMINLYIFLFLFIGLDLSTLFLAMKINNDIKNKNDIIILSPLLCIWICSIVFYIIYIIRKKKYKNKIKKMIEINKNKLVYHTKENLQKLYDLLMLRVKNKNNNLFEDMIIIIIYIFIPVCFKLIFSIKYKTSFIIFSSLYFSFSIFYHFFKLLQKCYQKKKRNYKQFYINKEIDKNDIRKNIKNSKNKIVQNEVNKHKTIFSSVFHNIFFFIVKIFLSILFTKHFFSEIGNKLDSSSKKGWIKLFIPLYICYIPIIGFSILHLISYNKILKHRLCILTCTFIPILLCFFISSVLFPLILEERIKLSAYSIPILCFIGTIFVVIHNYYLHK